MSPKKAPVETLIRFLLIAHDDFDDVTTRTFTFTVKEELGELDMVEALLLHSLQPIHDRECVPTCFWEGAEVYQIDLPQSFTQDEGIRESPELFGRRVTSPVPKHVYRNLNPQKLHFMVYPKHLTRKRARVNSTPAPYLEAAIAPPRPRADTVRPSKKSRKVVLTRIAVDQFEMTAKKRGIYEAFPVYKCGNPAVALSPREPPTDFVKHLTSDGVLFADFSESISQLEGDVNGFYTSALSRSSAKSHSSMLQYFRDRHHRDAFVETFGQLRIGSWALNNPLEHSQDYILSFTFSLPRGAQTRETILQHLASIIDDGLENAIDKYGDDLSIASANALFGKKNGCDALAFFFKHFKRHSQRVEESTMSIFIEDYDSITRYAEVMSLTTSPSSPSYPSVDEIIDILETHFYNAIYAFKESFGARIYFFGVSPALATRLSRFPAKDATKTNGGLGVAGYMYLHFQAFVAAFRGELDARGQHSLRTALVHLPKYRYRPKMMFQIPQLYAHKMLHLFGPSYDITPSEHDIVRLCNEDVNILIDSVAQPAVRAVYARRAQQWEPSLTALAVQGVQMGVPVSDPYSFRHTYGNLPPDGAMRHGYKLVQRPETPQPFYAFCYDEGILTGSKEPFSNEFNVPHNYTFPCPAMKTAFLEKVVKIVKMTGLSVLEPFDGTAEWWYKALSWYLKATRTAVSNYFFTEGELQCLSLNLCQISLSVGAGSTALATLETQTDFGRRIDILYTEKLLTVVTEDKNIPICNVIEGTLGFTFPRKANNQVNFDALEPRHREMITAFSEYCRNVLPEDVFKNTPFKENYPKKRKVTRDLKKNPPTKLEHFFYVGWNKAPVPVWGTYSIFSLWEEAEGQGDGYAKDIQAGNVDDPRYDTRWVGKDGETPQGVIVVLLVIVVAGLLVLSRQSKNRFRSVYILTPTRRAPR